MMPTAKDLRRHWREILLAALYVLPTLALAGLGGLWLWEKGLALYFAAAVLVASVMVLSARALWRPPAHGITLPLPPGAAPAEHAARQAVQGIIDTADPDAVLSAAGLEALATRTVLAVAEAYHPGDKAAWLNVSLPEALLMAEDTARRLRQTLNADLPVFRQVHISTLMRSYALGEKLVGLAKVARLARWVNPGAAVMGEIKSVLTDALADSLTGAVKAKAAAIVVREVGETAIKLYSGGYRRTEAEIAARAVAPPGVAPPPPRPPVILVAGQANAGKSSLINALAGRIAVPTGRTLPTERFYRVEIEHGPAGTEPLVLIDSPGVGDAPDKAWLEAVREADLILWTAAANRADRAADQRALRSLRDLTRQDIRSRDIPLVLAVTHADRLNPPMEWQPPYDPAAGERPKERSMRDALAAIAASLSIAGERAAIVSVEGIGAEAWNLEALWGRIAAALPDARHKQMERALAEDGLLQKSVDVLRSIPGAVNRILQ